MVDVVPMLDLGRPVGYSAEPQPLNTGVERRRNLIRSRAWRPPTDLYETEEKVFVRVEIAGMKEENFSIALIGRILTIRGFRPDVAEKRAFHQMEISFGEFLTEVELPCGVISEAVQAEYQAGFLRVELPKERPSKIRVSVE